MSMVNITKIDSDRNLVFGWAYVSIDKDGEQVVDHSGEAVDPEELEEAAYLFNLDFRKSGEMHEGEAVGELIESFMVTPEKLELMGISKDSAPIGLWVGFYVDSDEVFEKIKNGKYTAFSIQGNATREAA